MSLENTSTKRAKTPTISLFQKRNFISIFKLYFYIMFGRSNLLRLALRMRFKDKRNLQKGNRALESLHESLERIRNQSIKEYPHYDYGSGYNYQSLEELNLSGFRLTEKRVSALNLNQRLQGKRVLDIGSNMGCVLFSVRDSIKSGLGVEINKFLVEQSDLIASYLNSNKKLKFICTSFENLSKNQYSFDVILSLANHSTYDGNTKQSLDSYFSKIYELLADDGQLIFESHPPEIEPYDNLEKTFDIIKKYFSTTKIEVKGLNGFLDKNRTYIVCKKV
jgi:spermidine synthase